MIVVDAFSSSVEMGIMLDIGPVITGVLLALVKFILIMLRAWPVLLLLLFILYFGKKRFKNSKR